MLELFLSAFVTLFVVIDPPGCAPIYAGLTANASAKQAFSMALRACLIATGILLVFALFGEDLLGALHIELDAFRIAGGIMLFLIALDMVFARPSGSKETAEEEQEAQERQDISVFPLAIPLIAGPGTLASIMILAGDAHGSPLLLTAVFLVTGVVLLLCYLALRLSGQIARVIGLTGVHVVTRVLGVLLGALAVQYVADGTLELLRGGLKTGTGLLRAAGLA